MLIEEEKKKNLRLLKNFQHNIERELFISETYDQPI